MLINNLLLLHVALANMASTIMIEMEHSKLRFGIHFHKMRKLELTRQHQLVFVRKQKNLNTIKRLLESVSNPRHSKYGAYLRKTELDAITKHDTAATTILAELRAIGAYNISFTGNYDYITAVAPIHVWEVFLSAEFYEFECDLFPNKPFVRAHKYSLPHRLWTHTSSVLNTVQIPSFLTTWSFSYVKETSSSNTSVTGFTTPTLLNALYNIRSNAGNNLTSQAVYANIQERFSPSDLAYFQESFDLPLDPLAESIGDHVSDNACANNFNFCAEANLDVQYIKAVAQGVPTTFYYWNGEDVWLQWILAVSNMENPPHVFSISYGGYELFMSDAYLHAFNIEAMKLSLRGVTLLAASGDDGAAGYAARILGPLYCSYLPIFPASSPFVTAVGGTMGPESGNNEIACQSNEGSLITSGGGFSNAFTQPEWQMQSINRYFNTTERLPLNGFSKENRGYPDISALANNFLVVANKKFFAISGTSAACPVVAGMVSLINSERLRRGDSTVGWLNPSLYMLHKHFVNDIQDGMNRCIGGRMFCCPQGFYCNSGWDPVTGLGSLDFDKFLSTMLQVGAKNKEIVPQNSNLNAGSDKRDIAVYMFQVFASSTLLVLVGVFLLKLQKIF